MKVSMVLGLSLLAAMSAGSGYAQNASLSAHHDNKQPIGREDVSNVNRADLTVKSATDDPKYVIGPEDELIVSVWREPEISRTVPVRPDGKISLALLNDVQATGLTPMQLSATITDKLKDFISEPQVTVIVSKINSQRVFVVGEVIRTGAYTLLPNMSVLDALSGAGGFTPFAKRTKVYIVRTEDGKITNIPFNYKEAIKSRRPERDLPLKPGDRIIVP